MDNLQSELNKIRVSLLNPRTPPDRYQQLYAAQQALSWVASEGRMMSPYDAIIGGKVWAPIKSTPANSEDCSGSLRQALS